MRRETKDRGRKRKERGRKPIIKALMEGQGTIDGISVACFVLEDERSVISSEGISAIWGEADLVDLLEKVHPFLEEDIEIIEFTVDRDGEEFRETGVAGEKLIEICRAVLVACLHGQLQEWAPKAMAIIRASFATGVKALDDERTGFQYERPDNALSETFTEELRKSLQ